MNKAGMHFVAAQQVDVLPMEESSEDEDEESVAPVSLLFCDFLAVM